MFVNDASVNGDGTTVASGTTTYTTTNQFSVGTTVTIRVRATATYWSEVAAIESITVRGKYFFIYMHQYNLYMYIIITGSVQTFFFVTSPMIQI